MISTLSMEYASLPVSVIFNHPLSVTAASARLYNFFFL